MTGIVELNCYVPLIKGGREMEIDWSLVIAIGLICMLAVLPAIHTLIDWINIGLENRFRRGRDERKEMD